MDLLSGSANAVTVSESAADEDAGCGQAMKSTLTDLRAWGLVCTYALLAAAFVLLPLHMLSLDDADEAADFLAILGVTAECPLTPVDPVAEAEISRITSLPRDKQDDAVTQLISERVPHPGVTNPLVLQLIRDRGGTGGYFELDSWLAMLPGMFRCFVVNWIFAEACYHLMGFVGDVSFACQPGIARGEAPPCFPCWTGRQGAQVPVADGQTCRDCGAAVDGDGHHLRKDGASWLRVIGQTKPKDIVEGGKTCLLLVAPLVFSLISLWLSHWIGAMVAISMIALSLRVAHLQTKQMSTDLRQCTNWDKAIEALRFPDRSHIRCCCGNVTVKKQAGVLASVKFFCWHLAQPVIYFIVFVIYFGCLSTPGLRAVGVIVAVRELAYVVILCTALKFSPVFLLLDLESEGTGFYEALEYILSPHTVVTRCLINRGDFFRAIFVPVLGLLILADCASCYSLAALLLADRMGPLGLKVGYTLTSASVFFFSGRLWWWLLTTAKASFLPGHKCKAYWSMAGGLCLCAAWLYFLGSFVAIALSFDPICSESWFWGIWSFATPECGLNSECGSSEQTPGVETHGAVMGQCVCSNDYISRDYGRLGSDCPLASAYNVSGDSRLVTLTGTYLRVPAVQCHGSPVYQRVQDDLSDAQWVLFLGGADTTPKVCDGDVCREWVLGPKERLTDCVGFNHGNIVAGNCEAGGHGTIATGCIDATCAVSPDACNDGWAAYNNGWRLAPDISIIASNLAD